ncbi:MAG: HEPN domain-containing protein [Limnochordaceae bacterium]|nr:HEPN domain-containing protein [Limnochordaceae bacterium]
MKALLRAVGDPAVGRSLVKLTETLEARAGIPVPEELRQAARTLDRHYIPPRYPDAYPSGMPYEFYDQPTACEALENARRIAAFVRDQALALGIPPADHPSSHGTESSPPPGSGQTAEGTP